MTEASLQISNNLQIQIKDLYFASKKKQITFRFIKTYTHTHADTYMYAITMNKRRGHEFEG